jgi:ATP-binding protein involved in chromosome partitioning
VIVTTPQDVALIDARKALRMFHKLGTPVLGIVENMSHYRCPACGHVEHVFGAGGGRRTADELGVPFLGEVPLDPSIVSGGDHGRPVVTDRPGSPAAAAFGELARLVVERMRS